MILLFWFLIVALSLAWGMAGYQEDRLEREAQLHTVRKVKPAANVAPTQAPALAAPPAGDQSGATVPEIYPAAQSKVDSADKDLPKTDEPR